MTEVLADRYELHGLLGAGGMARVVEGYDRLLARRVAVKILRDDVTGDRTLPERFLREARATASFSHPNAVTVFDTGLEGRRPYIVMELVEGRTLADELAERGALPAGEAVEIAAKVLDALGAAHDRGLVHRDVKPANVLLPTGGGVKLADFGIAKELRDAAAGLTATGTVLGTPRYLAPEQVAGDPATPATDVYAVGVVLYEMLAGAPPFDGDSPISVALAHQRDPVPPLAKRRRELDPDLVAVVEQALAKDPSERFVDAALMRSALLDLPGAVTPLGGAATTVRLDRPAERTAVLPPDATGAHASADADRPRRRGAAWVALAALLVVVLMAAAYAATRGQDPTVGDPSQSETPAAPAVPAPAPSPGAGQDADADPAVPDPGDPGPEAPAPEPAPQPDADGDGGRGEDGDGEDGDGEDGDGDDEGGPAEGRGPEGEGPPGQDVP